MVKMAVIAFFLLIVQGLFTYLQISNYRKRVSALRSIGIVAVGTQKAILGSGNITILACNRQGKVVRGEKLEGITVFERFKEIKGIEGMSLSELKDKYKEDDGKKRKDGKKSAMLQAVENLEKKLAS